VLRVAQAAERVCKRQKESPWPHKLQLYNLNIFSLQPLEPCNPVEKFVKDWNLFERTEIVSKVIQVYKTESAITLWINRKSYNSINVVACSNKIICLSYIYIYIYIYVYYLYFFLYLWLPNTAWRPSLSRRWLDDSWTDSVHWIVWRAVNNLK